MWKIGRLTSQSCAVCVRRCISLYSIRGWWGLLEDVHSYLKEKGALAGSIYESFNYISQSEFQLERKVGKKKKKKICTACIKSMVINLWLGIMVNKVAVHHGIVCTILFLGVRSNYLFPGILRAKCSHSGQTGASVTHPWRCKGKIICNCCATRLLLFFGKSLTVS